MSLTWDPHKRLIRMAVSAAASITLVASMVLVTSTGAQAAPAQEDKVRPELAEALESKGESSFWIRFTDRADLSEASQVDDWTERGTAVVAVLKETAAGSQGGVIADLDRAGQAYQTFWVTNAIFVRDGSTALAAQLAARPEVEGLYAPTPYELIEPTPGEVEHTVDAIEWGIANINADDVWSQFGVRGEGITVANIDTGVQFDHPALVDSYRGNQGDGTFDHDYNWFDAAGACPDAPCDTNGHGSHTMGTMVGDDGGENQIGVAPEANWIAANGCCPSDAALIASGEWMLEPTDLAGENPDASKRPHIVNNSWGSTVPSNDPFMEDVLLAWQASGILGIWSNGNSGPACETSGSPGSRIINYSAGAYDVNNTIASFSARGPGQDGEIKPNISAPGVNVRSSVPGDSYAAFNGTSMAAPHVAGSVALMWSAAPALVGDLAATKALLDDTATDAEDLQCGGTADDNNVYGEGRLDALALLQATPIGDTGTLVGTVTDAGTGDPVAGASVLITGEVDRDLVTGEDGTYSVLLPVGEYTVSVSAFGYATQTATVTVTTDETTTQDFALVAQPTVTLSGQIRDGSGHGWPMYAKVTVQEGPDLSDYTNPVDGRYSLEVPANATYTLLVESQYPGYLDLTETVEVGGGNVTHDMLMLVDPDACTAAPGYVFDSDGLFETFDAETAPAGWTVVDNIGNDQVWRFDDPGNRGNLTGGDGGFAVVDSDFYGPGNSQDTSLVTPVVDLTAVAEPVIRFNQDYNNLGTELADVDVSVDGGATWATVLSQTGADARGPRVETVPIPQAAGQPDVQVRFHYHNASWEWWWEVDNVLVGSEVTCAPVDGGLVVGHVRDLNTNAPINGATVTSVDNPEGTATTFATPDDPGRPDGFYWLFSSLTGRHPFTESAGNYTDQTRRVNVQADWTTQANFRLAAGQLVVDPDSVEATIPMGGSAEREFTITNTGTAPASVELSERAGSFEILRADGTRLSEAQIRSSAGAPVQRVKGEFSPAARAPSSMAPNDQSPAATPGPSAPPWTNLPDYPRTIMDNSMAVLDGLVYSFGGTVGTAALPDAFVFDPAAQTWSEIADIPEGRQKASVAEIGGLIYLAGGWGPTGDPAAGTYVYDPGADGWSEAADMPAARSAAGTAVLDGQLYAVGGCVGAACAPSTDVQRYDPAGDSWETLAAYPDEVSWLACAGLEGEVYCTGGTDGAGASTSTYAYDPGSDSWTPRADLPYDNWAMGYAAANGQFLVSGGVTDGFAVVTNEGAIYDPAGDTWSDLPASNTTLYRGGSACGFYKVGGSSGGFTPTAFAEVLPGFDECASETDVPWLSVSPTTATLAPGDSVVFTVTMDANVAQPGTYTASIAIAEDTPYSVPPVGVTMNVTPPASWGKIAGTVDGIDCDGTRAPIAGAVVQIESWAMSITLITEADGTYAHWLDRRNNPLTMIVAKDDFQPQTRTTRVVAGETVTENFALRAIC